ncbi:MAG: tetratricopeptide repeat protein [Bdellovibrionota bacterium]
MLKMIWSLIAVLVLTTGCLQTRNAAKEQEEKVVLRKQVQNLQSMTADVNARFQDVEDSNRKLEGRVESIENKVDKSQAKSDQGTVGLDAKIKENDAAYKEEFQKLTAEIERLKLQLAETQANLKRASQDSPVSPADSFAAGDVQYEKKNYQEAILDYERYRKAYPKGRKFGAATLKIGQAFGELGLKDEARAFYEEVVSKFPKTKEAKTAAAKLKSLKK